MLASTAVIILLVILLLAGLFIGVTKGKWIPFYMIVALTLILALLSPLLAAGQGVQ